MAEHRKPSLVLMFGGPGAGKGTQAALLSQRLGVPHISSGDLLRRLERGTHAMARGELAPDDVVTGIILDRLNQPDAAEGAVLDGFPRTTTQAQALDAWLAQRDGDVRAAVYLEVPQDILLGRLEDRAKEAARSDDASNVARRRVAAFMDELAPILAHYAARNALVRIDGAQPSAAVHRQIKAGLPKELPPRQ